MAVRPNITIKLNAQKLRELRKQMKNARVHVGVLSAKGGGEKHPDSPLTYVQIAAIHEFGSPKAHIPQRSFIRSAFERKQKELGRTVARLSGAVLRGKMTLPKAMEMLGQWGVKTVQARMAEGIPPPLAPATLARREKIQSKKKIGRDVPLINTGRLRQSIAYEVKL